MNAPRPIVFVVDDEAGVRRSLSRLLVSEGHDVETFDSAEAYLDRPLPPGPACLVLDVKMPGMDGLQLQQMLADRGQREQIVFVTGHGDAPMGTKAMKAGAVAFLAKPFTSEALLDAVARALERARAKAS